MRIDKIEIRNFKKFAEQTIELDTKFTLLLGENGSGKTSALDALAVASGVWLVRELLPDSSLLGSSRPIYRPDPTLSARARCSPRSPNSSPIGGRHRP